MDGDRAFEVEVKLDDRSRVCRSEGELIRFLRELNEELEHAIAERKEKEQRERDARLRMGKALLAAKESVPHGSWMPFLKRVCASYKTSQACMRLAKCFADSAGHLDPHLVVERAKQVHGAVLKCSPRDLSARQLEQVSGSRPLDEAANRFLQTPVGGPVVQVASEPLFEEDDAPADEGEDLGDDADWSDAEEDEAVEEDGGAADRGEEASMTRLSAGVAGGSQVVTPAAPARAENGNGAPKGAGGQQLGLEGLYADFALTREVIAEAQRRAGGLDLSKRVQLQAELTRHRKAMRSIIGSDPG